MERLSKAIPNNRVSKMVENSKLTKLSLTHEPLDPDTLCSLLRWIDAIRLSRPKKCLHRDFADAVLVAEIISHFFPAKVRIRVRRGNLSGIRPFQAFPRIRENNLPWVGWSRTFGSMSNLF